MADHENIVKKRLNPLLIRFNFNLGHKVTFYTYFASPHPCAMLTTDVTQVCIWLFSDIERGNGGDCTYSIGITVMRSCFCHFPTQFAHGCLSFHISQMQNNLHRNLQIRTKRGTGTIYHLLNKMTANIWLWPNSLTWFAAFIFPQNWDFYHFYVM